MVGVGVTLLGKETAVGVAVMAPTVAVSCGVTRLSIGIGVMVGLRRGSEVAVNVSVAGTGVSVGRGVSVSVGAVVGDATDSVDAGREGVGRNPQAPISEARTRTRTTFFMMPSFRAG